MKMVRQQVGFSSKIFHSKRKLAVVASHYQRNTSGRTPSAIAMKHSSLHMDGPMVKQRCLYMAGSALKEKM